MQTITRRQFARQIAAYTAGLALTGGNGWISAKAWGAAPLFLQTRCTGGDARRPRVLVAYASMYGSTGDVADTIARRLCRAGVSADVRLVGNVKDIGDFQAVVIGSAIRSDQWLPEAMDFVATNKDVLSSLPTAYFLTCLTLAKPSGKNDQTARSFLDPVFETAPEVRPACIGLFPGVLDYSKYPRGMEAVMRYKMWAKGIEAGDYRDWDRVRDFSHQFYLQLVQHGLVENV